MEDSVADASTDSADKEGDKAAEAAAEGEAEGEVGSTGGDDKDKDDNDEKEKKDASTKKKKKKKKTVKVTKTKMVTERKKAKLDVVSHFTVSDRSTWPCLPDGSDCCERGPSCSGGILTPQWFLADRTGPLDTMICAGD